MTLGMPSVDWGLLWHSDLTALVLENFALPCTYEDREEPCCGHKDKPCCLLYASFSSPEPRAGAYHQASVVTFLHQWQLMDLSGTEDPLTLRNAKERVILQDASSQ